MMPRERAEKRIAFFDTYRSYVINYNLGQDLVKRFVEGTGNEKRSHEESWALLKDIISNPWVPSQLTNTN